jgi:uncharacterized membrane protein YdfJ with MMPL/SSD domain
MSRRYVSAITTRMPAAVGVVVVGVAILIIAGVPGLHLRLGLPDAGSQPTSQTTRQAYDLISKGFGPGANGPLLVVSYAPRGITAGKTEEAAGFYAQAFASFPDIADISPPEVNPANNLALIEVIPKTGPNDPRTSNLITLIRNATAGSQQRFGLQTYVTGQTALNVDVSAKLSSALPLYLGVVVVLCLLILLMVFRSFLVPLTAVIGYILSILATLGVLTFVFQEGHFANLFGVSRTGPILSFLPVLMIGILFGLAMDYEVFLVSRMREEFVNHGDPQSAIVEGYSDSAKVVASAGIIMTAVFAAFIFSDDPTTKSLGFALALGVLLDAFVVRMTLVPASMRLFGRGVWWLPGPLERRLPDLDIEGSKLDETPAPTPRPSASLTHG